MKKIFLVSALALAATFAARPQDPSENAEVRQYIEEKNRLLEQWLAEGLMDSLVGVFSEDVVQMPPHSGPVVGIRAFRKNWRKSFEAGTWDFHFTSQQVKRSGDLAVERGIYTLNFKPKANAAIPAFKDKGNYIVVWERNNDRWQIVWNAPVSSRDWEGEAFDLERISELHRDNDAVRKK